jgi:hypothetical protein
MSLVFAPVISFPQMSAPTLVAVGCSLRTALAAARIAQARASADAVANRSSFDRDEPTFQPVHAVPVEIPSGVLSCMRRLDEACATLVLRRREKAARNEKTPARSARRGISGRYHKAWNTLGDQFGVWRKAGVLGALPAASRAAITYVFGATVAMPELRGSVRAQWTVGGETLDRMRVVGVDAIILSLGGGSVLANLQRMHDEVGAAFGMTAAVAGTTAVGDGTVGGSMANVRAVLREYVLKVHAMVDPEVPGSEALAATLLAPLVDLANAPSPVKGKARGGAKAPAKPVEEPVEKPETTQAATEGAPVPLRPTGTG